MATLKRILSPLASLKLTVVLIILAMVLVYAGTGAQMNAGVVDVQRKYFHSLFCKIDLKTLFLRQDVPGKPAIKGAIPMLGGYSIGLLLLINLLSAHTVRFKLSWKRSGVILIHLGLILLLVGEGISSAYQVDTQMPIDIGGAANWTNDVRACELAVTDPSNPAHDRITSIPTSMLKDGAVLHDAQLPFDIKVDEYHGNSVVIGPKKAPVVAAQYAKANAGAAIGIGLIPEAARKGVGDDAEIPDFPSAYLSLSKDGKPLGTYLVSSYFGIAGLQAQDPELAAISAQHVEVGGKSYEIALRFIRHYKPYTVTLLNFEHKVYTGTEMARDFRSTIRLNDPSRGVDREVKVWMNHPLRYQGETFYQSKVLAADSGSVLQVVSNPGWLMPYVACGIGGLGMLIHFGMALIRFLRKRAKTPASAVLVVAAATGKRAGRTKPIEVSPVLSYSFALGWGVPLAICALMGFVVLMAASPAKPNSAFDVNAWGRLPVSFGGRIQPLDSVARNAMKVLSNGETFYPERTYKTPGPGRPAVEWLAQVMNAPTVAANYKIFRIDAPDVKSMFTDNSLQQDFSPAEIFARWPKFIEQIMRAQERSQSGDDSPKKKEESDDYVRNLFTLWEKVRLYLVLSGEQNAGSLPIISVSNPEIRQKLGATSDKQLFSLEDIIAHAEPLQADLRAAVDAQASERTPYQNDLMRMLEQAEQSGAVIHQVIDKSKEIGRVHAVPPLPGGDWMDFTEASKAAGADAGPPFGLQQWTTFREDFKDKRSDDFNESVATYTASLDHRLPQDMERVRFEASFNQVSPFFWAMILYVLAFALVCGSWLGFTAPLYRSAVGLVLLAFALHTGGLIARIYISGRPPVTNLASSAIFIAWGLVVLAGLQEIVFRNSIGVLAACAAGFVSLLISHHLSMEGDTMKVLEAVLDTNGWLATHVVCITLGYSATFLAGVLGIVYVIRGFFDGGFGKEASRELARMIYGTICFGMLFSFVGTILGGIWADQSWGRFWGWDPKENGAVLIVLANALVLHARWGGVIRERGLALFAIFGNIVTAWSWFGTNMLGVGLHSYGFMPKALIWLLAFDITQVVIVLIGLLPMTLWANAEQSGKLPLDTRKGQAKTLASA